MSFTESKSQQPVIRPRVIRSVTIPPRAAECAVILRDRFLQDSRFPTVEELSEALHVTEPAVVQMEHILRKRGVLKGSRRAGSQSLTKEFFLPDIAVIALVSSTMKKIGFDKQTRAPIYSDCERGPYSEDSFANIVREKAILFGFHLDHLRDILELVNVGYLRGRPGRFGLNMRLWERDKLVLIKIFQRLSRGKLGAREDDDREGLLQSLARSVVLIPGNHDLAFHGTGLAISDREALAEVRRKAENEKGKYTCVFELDRTGEKIVKTLDKSVFEILLRFCTDKKVNCPECGSCVGPERMDIKPVKLEEFKFFIRKRGN